MLVLRQRVLMPNVFTNVGLIVSNDGRGIRSADVHCRFRGHTEALQKKILAKILQ